MITDDIAAYLNDLIATCKCGEADFARAAGDTRDPGLKSFFADRAQSCRASAVELQEQVRALGCAARTRGRLYGALRRRWLDLTAALPHSDDAILARCERAGAAAKARYARALDVFLPEDVTRLVQRQYRGVVDNLERVRHLRDLRETHAKTHRVSHA